MGHGVQCTLFDRGLCVLLESLDQYGQHGMQYKKMKIIRTAYPLIEIKCPMIGMCAFSLFGGNRSTTGITWHGFTYSRWTILRAGWSIRR